MPQIDDDLLARVNAQEACQFCGETGFDPTGLAQHVRDYCEVVERLYGEQMASLEAFYSAIRQRRADHVG